MKVACPRCQTHCDAVPGTLMTCPTCGFTDAVRAPHGHPGWAASGVDAAWRPATQPPGPSQQPVTQGIAIAALLLNILLLPGLGSVIGGRIEAGIWQLALSLGAGFIAVVLVITIVGILLLPLVLLAPIAAWVWGLITGIELIRDAQ